MSALKYRFTYEDAQLLSVEFGRTVEDEAGFLHPHPEHADRHTITVMLAEGDKIPSISTLDRITVTIEKDSLQ